MVFQIKFTPLTSSLVCTFLGAVLTLGLAFTSQTRLMVLLMIPQFFTSKGRTFLLMYAVVLVMNHPVQNFNKNVLVMSDSSTCGQEMAFNQTKEVIEAAFSPMAGVINMISKLMDALKQFAALIRKAFTALQSAITEIAAVLGRALKWLGNIVNTCNEKMGQPFRRCNKAFETAFTRCKAVLYRQKYLNSDKFDNYYLTFKVQEVDQRRKQMGKESIYPMTRKEKGKYVSSIPPHLKMHVQGRGAMADMYRAMISMFDPLAQAGVKLDTTPCLPTPYEPEWAVYDEIGKYEICRKLLKYLGWNQKSCLSCGREGRVEDKENFYHCVNGDCGAVYCCDCFDDLNNMCTVCMNPIDYGDLSDYSEERDSSEDEDEYLKKKEEARLRREERDRLRAENSPSKLLMRTGFIPIAAPKKNDDNADEASSQIDEDFSEVFSDEMA
ncbi:unnamed protein product [Mytilus edulis]|uniref:Dendritic cell-specific transmembrane protein-like domain-containing protein n=1 Tax=Mytilus edulis TaxID=6550 RepID=A0A8S3QKB8_MYTED|nr:unnamed protein product [Mytilus edulis]